MGIFQHPALSHTAKLKAHLQQITFITLHHFIICHPECPRLQQIPLWPTDPNHCCSLAVHGCSMNQWCLCISPSTLSSLPSSAPSSTQSLRGRQLEDSGSWTLQVWVPKSFCEARSGTREACRDTGASSISSLWFGEPTMPPASPSDLAEALKSSYSDKNYCVSLDEWMNSISEPNPTSPASFLSIISGFCSFTAEIAVLRGKSPQLSSLTLHESLAFKPIIQFIF